MGIELLILEHNTRRRIDFDFFGCYPGCEDIAPETRRTATMTEPIITCPNCKTETRLAGVAHKTAD